MEQLEPEQPSDGVGMHTERLAGRTQQMFFSPEEGENFTYSSSYEVDFNKRAELDAAELDSTTRINHRIRELISEGCGSIVVKNPGAKHSLGVGILNRLQLSGSSHKCMHGLGAVGEGR